MACLESNSYFNAQDPVLHPNESSAPQNIKIKKCLVLTKRQTHITLNLPSFDKSFDTLPTRFSLEIVVDLSDCLYVEKFGASNQGKQYVKYIAFPSNTSKATRSLSEAYNLVRYCANIKLFSLLNLVNPKNMLSLVNICF